MSRVILKYPWWYIVTMHTHTHTHFHFYTPILGEETSQVRLIVKGQFIETNLITLANTVVMVVVVFVFMCVCVCVCVCVCLSYRHLHYGTIVNSKKNILKWYYITKLASSVDKPIYCIPLCSLSVFPCFSLSFSLSIFLSVSVPYSTMELCVS